MVEHATLSGTALHDDKQFKQSVRAASTANVTLATPGSTMDGVTLSSGDRVLLKDQSTASQNGIYTWTGAATLLTRTADADAASDFFYNFLVGVREGTANGAKVWMYTQTAAVTLGSTSITFSQLGASSGTVTSVALTVPAEFSVAGSPVTGSGTLAVTKATQTANTIYAGPTTGAAAAPTFRAAVGADLPVFVASGASHAVGAVPDPGVTAGSTKFLREDATWATPSGGGSSSGGTGGSIVPIQTQTPSSTGTVTFSVPAGFKNLRFTGTGRGTDSAAQDIRIRFNSDSGANYNRQDLAVSGSTVAGAQSTAQSSGQCAILPGTSALSSAPGSFEILIPDHSGTTFFKQWAGRVVGAYGAAASSLEDDQIAGYWASTAAISSITLLLSSGNFVSGSTITLWGEADTAPVLLTSNSNLIQETILTATTASVTFSNIPQGYRDLRLVVHARGDNAAVGADLRLQANGDTASNYAWNSVGGATTNNTADSSTFLAGVLGASATASYAGPVTTLIPNYTGTTFFKSWTSYGGQPLVASGVYITTGTWKSTSAITSLKLIATSNFIAGSSFKLYGEPAAAAGPSVGTGTRLRLSGNQSITSATATAITWDTEDNDADNQHYTSVANLTGTVAKAASSTTLTGTTTAFTTELSVGQVISVPGTAAERRVVVAIASDTSLTVNTAFVNTASGQTAARVNSAVVFRQPGFYTLETNIYSAALASGAVTLAYYLNSLTTATSGTAIAQRDPTAINASAGYDLVVQRQFQQWDFVEVVWTQNSGAPVNVTADERTHWSISARPTVIVAIPYVCIQDQKAQNTAGGTFTSGADRTRDLNTVISDTAGISSLASNQFTLGPGTYTIRARAPAAIVNAHQAFLYNATDAAAQNSTSGQAIRGSSAYADATGTGATDSVLNGQFSITGSKAFEIRHRAQTTRSTNGFGNPANFGVEVYTSVEIWKDG